MQSLSKMIFSMEKATFALVAKGSFGSLFLLHSGEFAYEKTFHFSTQLETLVTASQDNNTLLE